MHIVYIHNIFMAGSTMSGVKYSLGHKASYCSYRWYNAPSVFGWGVTTPSILMEHVFILHHKVFTSECFRIFLSGLNHFQKTYSLHEINKLYFM